MSKLRQWHKALIINLGITQDRKTAIYRELIESVALKNVGYWVQVLFAAGIATLGLVLNSPAVIIGAMLISPLMGGILALGLSFATADFILFIRATLSLGLSCVMAIAFAILLVGLLPFKEMTAEILGRTHPNVLDLGVALFSGGIGAIATCKESKGVLTSIPGVSIAVALMPPLCVVGYGIGLAISLNWQDGLQAAMGAGLLFLTNLVAITFMAMVVFLLFRLDTRAVRQQIRQVYQEDPESQWLQTWLDEVPALNRLRTIGSLPSRLIVILLPILLLLVPLTQSFQRLSQEVIQKQEKNRLQQIGQQIWKEDFANLSDGQPRSYIGQWSSHNQAEQLVIQLTILTSQFYTPEEQQAYKTKLAQALQRSPNSIQIQLVEIPTSTHGQFQQEPTQPLSTLQPSLKPTIGSAQALLWQNTEVALEGLKLPASAQLLRYEVTTSAIVPLQVAVVYLHDRILPPEAQELLVDSIRDRLQSPNAIVNLIWVSSQPTNLAFELDQSQLSVAQQVNLNQIGSALQKQPNLKVQLTANREAQEMDRLSQQRIQAIQSELTKRWQVAPQQMQIMPEIRLPLGQQPRVKLQLSLPQS